MHAPADVTAFVRAEHPRLVRALDLLTGDHAVAEELAQEALLRAVTRWEHVSGLDSPGGWTHRVAINLANSQLRRRRAARRAASRVGPRDAVAAVPDTAAAIDVRMALRELPEAQRRVLVLRHVLQWTPQEIAQHDGVRADAVRQQLHRATAAIRTRLGDHQEEPTDAR